MSGHPAVLGGQPVFEQKVMIVRPDLPQLPEMAAEVESILSSGMVTKGRFLRQFEEAAAEHLGVRNAVAVSSCTTGLMLTYKALGLSGDVVVPSFTFMATVAALVWRGLRPVYADVDAGTTNLDVRAAEAAITPRTSAIVAVHNFGNPADAAELEELCRRRGLKLIFDAAHGFGAIYQGRPVGAQGDANVYSLSPTKLLIAGEGGIVATNNDTLAEQIRIGREYGNNGAYDSLFAGMNARMPEFNALLGLHSLRRLEAAAQSRNESAGLFQELLGALPGVEFQQVRAGNRCSYKDFSIVIDAQRFGLSRNELQAALAAEGVDTRRYYEPPVHRQLAYQQYADDRPLPATDWLADNSLSLPIWSFMPVETARGISSAVLRIAEHAPAVRAALAAGQPA